MERFSLKQLYTFLVVVQVGGFQAASRRLNASQAAISNRIAQLEESLGVRLLDRSTRHCRPTPKGRRMVPYAQRVVAAAAELRANVGAEDAISGQVVLGVVEAVAVTWLDAVLHEVEARLPKVSLEIEVDVSGALVARVVDGTADLACAVAPADAAGLISEPLCDIALAWVASPTLAISSLPLTPTALAEYSVIAHAGSRHAPTIERWLHLADRQPRRLTLCNNLSTVIKLTVAGGGLALVPVSAVANEIAAGLLRAVPFSEPLPPNPFMLVYPSHSVDLAVLAVVEVCRDIAARQVATIAVPPPAVSRPALPAQEDRTR